MDPTWVDVFPIENGDIPASYVRNYQRVNAFGKMFFAIKEVSISFPMSYEVPFTTFDDQDVCYPVLLG